jgi:hypothetical protein
MTKTRFLLPIEPLLGLGIVGAVYLGMQVGIGAYQKWENWGKVWSVNGSQSDGM